jgi:outer membrane receptor protein involved in Fe transport
MLLALFLALSLAEPAITGVVKDASGGAVAGASVVLQTVGAADRQTITGPDGRFTIDKAPERQSTLIVRAGGFAEKRQPLTAGSGELEVVLTPAAILEEITVTPSRTEQRLGDVPASVAILDATQIRQSPAVVADDLLRQLPTFSLFRRASSLAAHPTTQGVSLRGIGPSGVSRTLVLIDDVPVNDPFGGWVYWSRLPLDTVDRIEVVEGPSSSVYGNYGMGGVINIVSSRARRQTIEAKPQFGNRDTRKLDLFGSHVVGNFGLAVDGSLFDTDGFPNVAAPERGPIDNNVTANFKNVNVKADYAVNSRINTFIRVGHFREERENGKISTFAPLTEEANNTRWTSFSAGARIGLPDSSNLQVRLFGDNETFRSNFLAVPATAVPRSVGRITLDQRVPTNNVGAMGQWGRVIGSKNFLTAGVDWRRVDGDSEERAYDTLRGLTPTLDRVSGGTQRSTGAFVQDIFTPTADLSITVAARVDNWRNYDAHNLETTLPAGTPAPGNRPSLPDKASTVASPRIAAMYHVTDRVSAWGSYSAGFRAPTLNELYRQFRVGAIITLANEDLNPERLVCGELGANLALSKDLTVRGVWFDNRIKDPVSNVTIATNTQRRQNLGRTRIWGAQTDAEYRLGRLWRVSGAYLYNQATVRENPANPSLVGKFLPQVPAHRGSIHLTYAEPRFLTASVGAQMAGMQFDEDANVRGVPGNGCVPNSTSCINPGLPGYALVDFTASRAIGSNVEVFFGVQNIGDVEYYVGTNPTLVGSPRLVTGGVRLRFSGR